MRAVLREVPQTWLDERARLGLDRFDEMWEGVLHMAPAPGSEHQKVGSKLLQFLGRVLAPAGIEVWYQTEVHQPAGGGSDYRIPDLVAFRPGGANCRIVPRGLEGAPLAVFEILSPGDETYEKFDFYAALGVPDLVIIEPDTRGAEVHRLAGGAYSPVPADASGRVHVASLDVWLSTTAGPRLAVQRSAERVEL